MQRVAICPKCETFTVIEEHYRKWVCAHFNPPPIKWYEETQIDYDVITECIQKIDCKVVTMERGMVIDGN
jgi:hypothetical protein